MEAVEKLALFKGEKLAHTHESVMNSDRKKRCIDWLSQQAFPLWFEKGRASPAFYEGLDYQGQPKLGIQRCMIQWRQVYCFTVAHQLNFFPREKCFAAVVQAAEFIDQHYSLPNGGFAHAIDAEKKQSMAYADLYNQAFSLFGLACVYSLTKENRWKVRAIQLLDFLERERVAAAGGFTETDGVQEKFASNPHMHLFEALLAWQEIDPDPRWRALAQRIGNLCQQKFIDAKTGFLAEYFAQNWQPLRDEKGFVAEPGHHFEWSWLFSWAEGLGVMAEAKEKISLFAKANEFGVCPTRHCIVDEIYSDGSVKKSTARYWPPCEKVKAAVRLGASANGEQQKKYFAEADSALDLLFRYLDTPLPGLCWDVLLDDNTFSPQPPRASSLYHIVNAMKEYLQYR
jgi:mannose/cellobiose epimerase-like protein (N-acyl-D-glucosamine 2-epimerase family)